MTMITLTADGVSLPVEPDWAGSLDDALEIAAASAHWAEIIGELTIAGTVSPANGHSVRRLVEARLLYERAAQQCLTEGATVRAPKTKTVMYSPFFVVMLRAGQACDRIEAELGLAPTRRAKAAAAMRPKKKAFRAADEFLPPRRG